MEPVSIDIIYYNHVVYNIHDVSIITPARVKPVTSELLVIEGWAKKSSQETAGRKYETLSRA